MSLCSTVQVCVHNAVCMPASIFPCRTEHNVKLLMTAAMGVHTLEALFTAWLCWRAGLSHEQMM
jgi:hypothetical protein